MFFLTQGKAQEQLDSTIILKENIIFFDTDSFKLTQEHEAKLASMIAFSKRHGDFLYYVSAHTDQKGSSDYNIRLSYKRQQSVVNFLNKNEIHDTLIKAAHYGEEKPISAEEDAQNRRVLIQLGTIKRFIYLSGEIIDEDTKKGIPATITLKTAEYQTSEQTDSSGKFRLKAPLKDTVSLEVLAEGYFIETNNLVISDKHKTLYLKIPLPKIELGRRYLFKNMLFEGNRSMILPKSQSNVFHLKRFMEVNKDVCIEICGHINLPGEDNIPVNSGHFELSVARALEIKNGLLEEGIDVDRLLARGYGNWQMKYPQPKNDEQSQLNRRVEIEIISCSTATKEPDHSIEDLERYRYPAFMRTYNEGLIKYDLRDIPKHIRLDLIIQANKIRSAGLRPEAFTYEEIFNAIPEFPSEKK